MNPNDINFNEKDINKDDSLIGPNNRIFKTILPDKDLIDKSNNSSDLTLKPQPPYSKFDPYGPPELGKNFGVPDKDNLK